MNHRNQRSVKKWPVLIKKNKKGNLENIFNIKSYHLTSLNYVLIRGELLNILYMYDSTSYCRCIIYIYNKAKKCCDTLLCDDGKEMKEYNV